ncbi:MAG: NfeD family protein [Mariprofundaceae bacterium]|nr:NfeD family protein [Mariprofundaceae bacterium]
MFESLGLEIWHIWLIAASVIAIIELLLVGSYYLLAVVGGAVIVGLLSSMVDISLTVQWFIFTFATVLVAVFMRSLRSPAKKEIPDDISYMEGKLVSVLERVSPRGRVMYKSVSWAAESEDIFEVDETARIKHVDGSTLFIEKIDVKKGEV